MGQNLRLGRIAGIPVGINWSVLVIFLLITWELADLVLPGPHPGEPRISYWAVAVGMSVLFFFSLLAHEVSHSVVAKRNGVGVRRITLWLFGGVSELERDALTPQADFAIAVVGPLVSLILGALFGILWTLARHVFSPASLAAGALGWLALINLMLGGFNLIPGAPLDGGRVLRAALWHRHGDRASAARTAARSGEVIGYILIVLGVFEFLTESLSGLWFVFLGWFLLTAARGEETSVVMRESLANVVVRDVMTVHPTTFPSSMPVEELLDRLHHYRFSSYPLVDHAGQLDGLTTLTRIRQVAPHARVATDLLHTACPIAEVPIGGPDEPVVDILQRMQGSGDGRALVVDAAGHLVGIVSPSDIARYIQVSMVNSQGRRATRA